MPQFDDPEDAASRLSNLETQSSAQRGSAALTSESLRLSASPAAHFLPRAAFQPARGRLFRKGGPAGKQSLPARQSAEPQVVPGWIEGNLDKHEVNSPLPRGYAFRPILSASRMVFSHSGKAIQL